MISTTSDIHFISKHNNVLDERERDQERKVRNCSARMGSESVRWISGEGDFSAKDDTGAILLLNENKYLACLNTQAGKVSLFHGLDQSHP